MDIVATKRIRYDQAYSFARPVIIQIMIATEHTRNDGAYPTEFRFFKAKGPQIIENRAISLLRYVKRLSGNTRAKLITFMRSHQ
jgi:hypothetical protein